MSKPLVAVVGRPNVGKSTFFNKVVGRRVSIVEDTPGVTRDRIYAEAEWKGIHFALIDTGGIEPDSKDIILSQMRHQAEMAMDTSDVILFMVDGKEGITAADREVASMLMKTGKKIVLAVNKLVLDCANGAAYRIAEKVYSELGADITVIGNEPNGVNINDACGSTHPEKLQEEVIRQGAFLGMAYDGDADRLIAVDEKGRIIDGDKLICICAQMMKDRGELPGDLVTATVMSNIGFHKYVEGMGCKVEVTSVGDRYVLESMLKTGCNIGGEQSGHIIFRNHTTTGDGILSSLQLLQAVILSGKLPSELSDGIEIFPQVLKNARVKNENKGKFREDPEVEAAIAAAEKDLEGEGRVLIRPSGTEPLVRVMLEGQDVEKITGIAEKIAVLLTKKFG